MHILILGANKGIGLALVKKFINEGHQVTATCRNISDELAATGAHIIDNVDVTNVKSLELIKTKTAPVDILVNNAGILIGDDFNSVKYEDVLRQFEVNALGPLKVAKTLSSLIKEHGKFGIITSRMGSIEDNTSGGQYGYRASKCAANAIGKSLSYDLKEKDICVLLLHPGYVRTDMTDHHGLIDPPESAEGLFHILINKKMSDTGTFWHTNGEKLPW